MKPIFRRAERGGKPRTAVLTNGKRDEQIARPSLLATGRIRRQGL
jgi:hypothetical protein